MLTVKTNQLTADGCQDILVDDSIYCCPPPLCGNDLCCTFVAFFQMLPTGPLWDYWKAQAVSYFQRSSNPAECPIVQDPACPSIILHSIYTVLKLKALVHNALWPAFRESDPNTAITTLDNHLARLQWEDCYEQHCRSVLLGEITPLEMWSDCGPVFVPPDYPPELICALKRNIAIALTRAQMGTIKNLCGLNWIIEPLGAEIHPVFTRPPGYVPPPPNPCDPPDYACNDVEFQICYTRDWLEGCSDGDVCDTLTPLPKVQAYWYWPCNASASLPQVVWPGLLAAECIVRSMLPSWCPSKITRCC